MNQFKKIDFKGSKQALRVAKDFDYILNNLWSTYSEANGRRHWSKICKDIPLLWKLRISLEIAHVEGGHGREQSLMAVKDRMIEYLNHLIK